VISVRELQLPAAAMKEFRRSEKSISSRDFLSAADHLKKALRIEPDFVQAHNNLGATYMELEKFEDAISEFKKTIELDPKMEAPYRNMSLSLFELGRYSEAEVAARQAVALNPLHGAARYTLGRALAAQGSTSAETEELLRGTLAEFPEARLPLAERRRNCEVTWRHRGQSSLKSAGRCKSGWVARSEGRWVKAAAERNPRPRSWRAPPVWFYGPVGSFVSIEVGTLDQFGCARKFACQRPKFSGHEQRNLFIYNIL
jgi:hypothetical protein